MAQKTRANLKNYFLKGNIPTEQDFHDFIDSSAVSYTHLTLPTNREV